MNLIALLIYLIIVGVVIALVYYIADAIPIPAPLNNIIKVVAVVIGCLIVILMLLQLVGIGPGIRLGMATVFMNYRELGDQLAIYPESARKLIDRQGWPKETGKDGRRGAHVPVEQLNARRAPILDRLRARIRNGKV